MLFYSLAKNHLNALQKRVKNIHLNNTVAELFIKY